LTLPGSAVKANQNPVPQVKLNYPSERKVLYDRVSKQACLPLQKRTIPPPHNDEEVPHGKLSFPPDASYVNITESQIVAPEKPANAQKTRSTDVANASERARDESTDSSMAARIMKNEKLFAILSSHSDIDHPICSECTSLLLQSYTARLASATRERDAYAGFLKQLQQSAAASTDDDEDAKVAKELATLKKEDEDMYQELLTLEAERAGLEAELADLEDESRRLHQEEHAFWASRNAFDDEMHELNTNLASLQLKYLHDEQQLEKLQRTNVYNDTFCIGHDGYFGTINGLRLGRLSGHNVEWAEINAAWGQTLLLLATVAERLGYEFQGYRLKPMGSTSRIEKLEYPQRPPSGSQSTNASGSQRSKTLPTSSQPKVTPLDLFSSGETGLGRLLVYQKFDNGLGAFLDCLAQLGDHVDKTSTASNDVRPNLNRTTPSRATTPKAVFPYKIQGDKIGNDKAGYVSIKLGVGFQQQQDENFTWACKFALTCCKFLLARISSMDTAPTW
jgi:beclin